jgi:hypothetical protein
VTETKVLHHYVVLRQDLPYRVMVAQTIHAAGESSPGNLPNNTHAVALAVKDEAALLALEECLKAAGVPHVAIREPDPPWNGALMAIGFPPQDRAALRRFLSSLPTLK